MRHRHLFRVLLAALSLAGCGPGDSASKPGSGSAQPGASSPASTPDSSAGGRIDLTFTYGSEKEDWIKEVTAAFNADPAKSSLRGKRIHVEAIPMGSGECIDEIIEGTRRVHLTSPASLAFIKLGNARWKAKSGKDLIESTENLVLSHGLLYVRGKDRLVCLDLIPAK